MNTPSELSLLDDSVRVRQYDSTFQKETQIVATPVWNVSQLLLQPNTGRHGTVPAHSVPREKDAEYVFAPSPLRLNLAELTHDERRELIGR